MHELQLQAGTIEYEDTGGGGPTLLLLHGLLMDGSLWRDVVADLRDDHRCVVPTLAFGSHRRPMAADADLTLRGHTRIVAELIERLALRDLTVVGSDLALAQVLAAERPELAARIVLCSQEAFENYPPGIPGFTLKLASRIPGGLNALLQPLRVRALRGLPMAFGTMSRHGIPAEITDRWLRPALTSRAIRRDLTRYVRSARRGDLVEVAKELVAYRGPALVVWAKQDRMMPPEHGRRLAELLPQGRLVEVEDSYTLIPVDQPAALAAAIRSFVAAEAAGRETADGLVRGRS